MTSITTTWHEHMNCTGEDPALFEYTATEEQQAQAEEICLSCPVFVACGEDAKARTAAAGTTRGAVKVRGYFAGVMYLGEPPRKTVRPTPRVTQPSPAKRDRSKTLIGEQRSCGLPGCDKVFVRHRYSGKQKYCSKRCLARARYLKGRPAVARVCEFRFCGVPLDPAGDPRSRYCCKSHKQSEHWRRVHPVTDRLCAYGPCGAPFETARSNHVYCSKRCRDTERAERREGRTYIPVALAGRPLVTCALPGCQARFPRGGATGDRRFCTTKHQQAAYQRDRRRLGA